MFPVSSHTSTHTWFWGQAGVVQSSAAGAALAGGGRGRGGPGGRGGAGNTRGRGGARGGSKVIIEPHKHEGIFIAKGKESMLVTKISSPASPSTARSGSRSMWTVEVARTLQKSSIACGTRSVVSSPQGCWVGMDKIFIAPGSRCYTSVQQAERVSVMLQISWVPYVFYGITHLLSLL